jgi:hypothetical protein
MKNFILFVAMVCGGASFLFYTAAREAPDGSSWAIQVCRAANSLCQSPQLLAFTAAALIALWVVAMFVSAIRD